MEFAAERVSVGAGNGAPVNFGIDFNDGGGTAGSDYIVLFLTKSS